MCEWWGERERGREEGGEGRRRGERKERVLSVLIRKREMKGGK